MCEGIYGVIKDFAQPVATVLAAFAVAFFAYRQWWTAHQQARTALDQLRNNLFDRRYEIYKTTRQLLRTLLNDTRRPGFSAFDVAQYYVVLDETIFFFPPSLCNWLSLARKDFQQLLEEHAGKLDATGQPQ